MWKLCFTATCILFLISVVARMATEASDNAHAQMVRRLLQKATHWDRVARNDARMCDRLHHHVMALTFVHAAREILSDSEIEQTCGVDVVQTARELEQKIIRSRQNLASLEATNVSSSRKTSKVASATKTHGPAAFPRA